MAWQLPQWLTLSALGTTGGQHLADDGTMERGVHLRWQLGRDLGYPPGGFDVYRRQHDSGQPVCVSFEDWNPDKDPQRVDVGGIIFTASGPMRRSKACKNGPGLSLAGPGHITITLPRAARSVTLLVIKPGGPGKAEAIALRAGRSRVVAEAVLKTAAWSGVVTLEADQIDSVTLGGNDLTICQVCAVAVGAGIDAGWVGPLNGKLPIYLPITHPDWPGHHAHAPNDLAEAVSRLPAGLPAASKTRYTRGFRDELHDLLYSLVGTEPQQQSIIDEAGTPVRSTGTGMAPSSLRLQRLQLLSLASIDPNIARELGVYFCDKPGAGLWDYRVVGHWGGAPYPGAFTTFDDLEAGAAVTLPLRLGNVRVLSPRPATAADASWRGTTSRALRLTASAAPIWISLAHAAPAVTVKLACAAGVTIFGYRNNAPIAVPAASAAAGDHALTLEDTAGIDAIVITCTGNVDVFAIVARRAAGAIGDLNAVTFGHAVKTPVAVRVPAIEEVVALPGRVQLKPNGTVPAAVNAAGIRWTQFLANESNLPGTPVRYHVQRDFRGNGTSAGAPIHERIVNQGRPTMVSTPAPGAPRVTTRPDGWPDRNLHYVDRGLADGWYGHRVQGIDLFGRLGHWSRAVVTQLVDTVAPPPPVNVRATYIDPDSPWLADADRTWSESNGSGVRVDWEWPGTQSIQAPDVSPSGEFRVYFTDGRLNALTGAVTSVSCVDGAATSTVTTDQNWTGAADALTDEYVRIGDDTFHVTGNTAGAAFTITVENLTSPTVVPGEGRFSIAFSPGRDYRIDYRTAAAWDRQADVESAALVRPTRGNVQRVTARSDGTLLVQATVGFKDLAHVMTSGVLVCNGVPYRALAHRTGTRLVVQVTPLALPSSTAPEVQPAVGQTLVYYPGRKYSVYISGITLAPVDGEAIALAHIGVTTCDKHGNEGSVSSVCKIVATRRSDGTTPAAPGAPASTADPLYASPADFYGSATYTLNWSGVAGATSYAVYRTSAAALFDRDRDQRQRLAGAYAGMDFSTLDTGPFADDEEFATWFESWKTDNASSLSEDALVTSLSTLASDVATEVIAAWRGWAARFYPSLADADVQELANRSGNENALQRVNAEPVEGESYDDSFDGRGVGSYVYRIRSIDESGNVGPWSDTFQPVHIYDVTPPATPAITSIVGGEQSVTLTWRANTEPDLAEYWLWRAETAEVLDDVRHDDDAVTKTVIAAGADAAITYSDTPLEGGTDYYYRVAAVDTAGNVSDATATLKARAVDTTPPVPPALSSAAWTDVEDTWAISVAWDAPPRGVQLLLQRKATVETEFTPVSSWIESDTSYRDETAEPHETYTYRLLARSGVGVLNVTFNETSVSALFAED